MELIGPCHYKDEFDPGGCPGLHPGLLSERHTRLRHVNGLASGAAPKSRSYCVWPAFSHLIGIHASRGLFVCIHGGDRCVNGRWSWLFGQIAVHICLEYHLGSAHPAAGIIEVLSGPMVVEIVVSWQMQQ